MLRISAFHPTPRSPAFWRPWSNWKRRAATRSRCWPRCGKVSPRCCPISAGTWAVESHSTGQKDRETGKASDPDADWGHHTTSGVDANGKAWTKVKSWFGYGLHVIADTHYELPVAVVVTCASTSESPTLRQMIGELFAEQPVLAERCEDFRADRGLSLIHI